MTMDDFLGQLKTVRRMGSMKSMLGMLPGIGQQLGDLDIDDKELDRTEAIIQSMTRDERNDVDLLNNSRRRRVSRGSGSSTNDVSQLVKSFDMVSSMGKQMSSMSGLSRRPLLWRLSFSGVVLVGQGQLEGQVVHTDAPGWLGQGHRQPDPSRVLAHPRRPI